MKVSGGWWCVLGLFLADVGFWRLRRVQIGSGPVSQDFTICCKSVVKHGVEELLVLLAVAAGFGKTKVSGMLLIYQPFAAGCLCGYKVNLGRPAE